MTEPVFHESHARIGHEPGRTPERLVIVALVLLVLVVIKPWGPTPEVATAPGPVLNVAPTTISAAPTTYNALAGGTGPGQAAFINVLEISWRTISR